MPHFHVHIHRTRDAFDPAKHPRGQPDNPGEFVAAGTGSQKSEKTKTDPASHPRVSGRNIGAWGASHGNSNKITGASASLMGMSGYRQVEEGDTIYHKTENKEAARLAKIFLKAIKDSPGAPEPRYHGFQNVKNTKWEKGKTIRIALTATDGDADSAAGYGIRLDPEDNEGPPTLFEFPVGTKMAGYTKYNKADAKDFGYTWSEALVAGDFEIVKTKKAKQEGWRQTPYTIVTLKPKAVFDPETSSWEKV